MCLICAQFQNLQLELEGVYPLLRFIAKTKGDLEWLAIVNALNMGDADAFLIADQLFEGAKNLSENKNDVQTTTSTQQSTSQALQQKILTEKIGFGVGIFYKNSCLSF